LNNAKLIPKNKNIKENSHLLRSGSLTYFRSDVEIALDALKSFLLHLRHRSVIVLLLCGSSNLRGMQVIRQSGSGENFPRCQICQALGAFVASAGNVSLQRDRRATMHRTRQGNRSAAQFAIGLHRCRKFLRPEVLTVIEAAVSRDVSDLAIAIRGATRGDEKLSGIDRTGRGKSNRRNDLAICRRRLATIGSLNDSVGRGRHVASVRCNEEGDDCVRRGKGRGHDGLSFGSLVVGCFGQLSVSSSNRWDRLKGMVGLHIALSTLYANNLVY
jgi:hypothetical protein